MYKKLTYILFLLLVQWSLINAVHAQHVATDTTKVDSVKARKLLLRDSLDYTDQKININTPNNEFAPLLVNGGLLYISNKPIPEAKIAFNKVYWDDVTSITTTKKTKVADTAKIIQLLKKPRNDDFTAATSNDNDILYWSKKVKLYSNSVEQKFNKFSTDQPFAYDDSTGLIIFAKKTNMRLKGKRRWELWQGYLTNGVVKQKRRLSFETRAADYIYPFITNDGQRLYFSSDVKGGQGGYDIYYVDKNQGTWSNKPQPITTSNINTKYDEIAASVFGDSILFSSNRPGGMGGFDVYATNITKNQEAQNLGYPMNTASDEVGAKKILGNYYVSTNRTGNFDVVSMKYLPVVYPAEGVLTFKADGSLAANQTIYVKDLELNAIIDSVRTDANANYVLQLRPNREYALATKNGNGVVETFNYATSSVAPSKTSLAQVQLGGTTPKQRKDSVDIIIAKTEQILKDSLQRVSANNKFIVHFNFNKYGITKKERMVLDSLLVRLQENTKTFAVIGAFTDCIGSYKYNYRLSKRRAQSVYAYLIHNGLNKNRIVSNGYSKKYTVSPCLTKYAKNAKQLQRSSRRAEIVLSDIKNTNWATLEKQRGKDYYTSIVDATTIKNPISIVKSQNKVFLPLVNKDAIKIARAKMPVSKKDTIAKVTKSIAKKDTIARIEKPIAKKDTIKLAKAVVKEIKKDSIAKVIKTIVKKDTIARIEKPIVKKDTIKNAKAVVKEIKKDTIAKVIKAIAKKDTIARIEKPVVKKDTIKVAKAVVKEIKKDTIVKVNKPIIKKDTIARVEKLEIKKDTIKVTKAVVKEIKKDTIAKINKLVIKKDTIARIEKPVVKKDTIKVAKAVVKEIKKDTIVKVASPVIKKDTIAKVNKPIIKKDTIARIEKPVVKKDTIKVAKAVVKEIKKDTIAKVSKTIVQQEAVTKKPVQQIIAKAATIQDDEDDMSKEDIVKALDSLAKLKREQERIVEYLTKRINKKPIEIFVSSDSVDIEVFDNGIHDRDSVSVIYNRRIVVDRQELKVNRPIKFKLKVDKNKKNNELILVAENLGTEPPNTAVMFVTEKSGRRQQVLLSTDLTHNEVIYFIRIGTQ